MKPSLDPLLGSKNCQRPFPLLGTVKLSVGGKSPIISQITRLRVIEHKGGLPGKELWLLLCMNTDGEIKYMLNNVPKKMPLNELIRVSQMRWTIKQLFQEGKSYLGLDEYEMRSYPGWHRHMALVNVVMHFLLTVRIGFGL